MSEQFVVYNDTGAIDGDESKWIEGTVKTTGEPYIEMPTKLFYTGTHKGVPYNEAKLDRIAANFQEPASFRDWSVPAQLDHKEDSRSTIGNLRKVWRTGQDLWGTARFIGEEAVRNVKNGLWRKVSMSVWPVSERIREFSITPFPHLTGTATFSDTNTESEDEPTMADKPKTDKAPAPETKTEEAPKTYSQSAIEQMLQQFNAKTAALEARVEASESKNQELEQVVRFAQVTKEVDSFSEAHKTSPAMRNEELALLQTFSDEQMELYRKLKAKQPQVVDTNVYGDQDPEKVAEFKAAKAGEFSEKDIEADALKYA